MLLLVAPCGKKIHTLNCVIIDSKTGKDGWKLPFTLQCSLSPPPDIEVGYLGCVILLKHSEKPTKHYVDEINYGNHE